MSTANRRSFLRFLGSAALTTAFPGSIQRALAVPARRRTGTIEDVEHVVFLMQENRVFDHYFGTLRGVRGSAIPGRRSSPPDGRSGSSPTAAESCFRSALRRRTRSEEHTSELQSPVHRVCRL